QLHTQEAFKQPCSAPSFRFRVDPDTDAHHPECSLGSVQGVDGVSDRIERRIVGAIATIDKRDCVALARRNFGFFEKWVSRTRGAYSVRNRTAEPRDEGVFTAMRLFYAGFEYHRPLEVPA